MVPHRTFNIQRLLFPKAYFLESCTQPHILPVFADSERQAA
jgi:hypothetical protein